MPNLKDEISRIIPRNGEPSLTFEQGTPILAAFGCVLLEKETQSGYDYTAVNLETHKHSVISRQKNALTERGLETMARKIRESEVGGCGRYEADRPVGKRLTLEKANEITNAVFKKIMPQYGYAVRTEQVSLAEHILKTVGKRGVTLAESEVGTGKTYAYCVPAVIAKRGRLNDERNYDLYPHMQYADISRMPIVIATSSIALQKALLTEYIPELSRILLGGGVIRTPLTAVLRKGRDNYICKRNLMSRLTFEKDAKIRQILEELLLPFATIDIAETAELPPRIKSEIAVPSRCFDTCKHKKGCAYLAHRENSQSFSIDIQICNHNYLLADTLCRADGQTALIPNYQTLIVDEAHKFLSAARDMYGSELRSAAASEVLNETDKATFMRGGFEKIIRQTAKKLYDESAKLFEIVTIGEETAETDDETNRKPANADENAVTCLRNMCNCSEKLTTILRDELFFVKAVELMSWLHQKYGAKIDLQSLKKLLPPMFSNAAIPREKHLKLLNKQRILLHRTICELPEIKRAAELERLQNGKHRYTTDPERYMLANDKSRTFDAVWNKLKCLTNIDGAYGAGSERIARLIFKLSAINEQSEALADSENLIYWLETNERGQILCAIPNNVGDLLFKQQWSAKVPTILTSGTLSAGGDFSRIKQTLGLDKLASRVTETTHPSPFNYRENVLIYINGNMPYPEQRNERYIAAVTDEIERLVRASHGHTAVLFTGYGMMNRVYAELQKRRLSYPFFKLERSTSNAIERFKKSHSGVLFASGALWEGIDIPGDALSTLIIVKLPFAVPDPIGEYEQTLYASFDEYRNSVLIPEMLVKLKQGFGRLVRTERDTGVVALLDCRAGERGAYNKFVLNALPDCPVTGDIADIEPFLRSKKSAEYFLKK